MRHEFFLEDVEMIQHVKDLSDPRNMAYEVNTFRYYNGFRPRKLMKAVLRDVFGIRVSGQRLMDLCQKLYSQVDGHPTPNN